MSLTLGENTDFLETKLSYLDQIGKDFEENIINDLGDFQQFITYRNPTDNHGWKCAKGKGTDLNLAVRKYKIFIEDKFNGSDYLIPAQWFCRNGLSRFDKLPIADRYNLHVILTNRPDNYNDVKLVANYFGISIITHDDLLSLITDILSNDTNAINNNPILTNPILTDNNITNDNNNNNNKNNTYQNEIKTNKTIEKDIYECVVYYFLQKNDESWLNG